MNATHGYVGPTMPSRENPTWSDVARVVRARIGAHCGLPDDDVHDDANLFEDLGLQSLDAAEMVTVIEEELDIELLLGTLVAVESVGDVIDVVARRLGAPQPEPVDG